MKPGESSHKGGRKSDANGKRKSDAKTDIDEKLSKYNRKSVNKCKEDDQCSGLSLQSVNQKCQSNVQAKSVTKKCNIANENHDKKDSKELCTSDDKITTKTKNSENYKSVTKNRSFLPKINIDKIKSGNKTKSSTFDRLLKNHKQRVNSMHIYKLRKNYVDNQNDLLKEDMPKKNETGKFQNVNNRGMSFDELLKNCEKIKDVKNNYDPIIQPSRSDIENCKNNPGRRSEQSNESVTHKCNKKANANRTMSFDELLKSYSEKVKSNMRKIDKPINKSDINNEKKSLDSNTQPKPSVILTCIRTESSRCMSFDELLKIVREKSDGNVKDDQKATETRTELSKNDTQMCQNNDKQDVNSTDSASGNQIAFDRHNEIFNTNYSDTDDTIDYISNQPNESVKEFSETNIQTLSDKSTIKCSESDKGLVKNNGLDDLGDLVRYINDDINLTVKLDLPNDFSDIPTTEPDVSTNELQSNLYLVSNSLDSSTLPILAF